MAHPTRGYGYNVVTVLKRLGDRDLSDVFAPARNQFDGGGSYGNGGAMRVAPVALCGEDEVERVIQVYKFNHYFHSMIPETINSLFAP